MPDLTLAQNVPQDKLDRMVAAFVERQGPIPMTAGTPAVLDGQGAVVTPAVPPAPTMTPNQFFKRKVLDFIKSVVAVSEREVAAKTVAETAYTQAQSDFSGI